MNQTTVTGQTFADLLSVSVQHLDSEAEMRKFFGAKVVQANRETSSAAGPSRRKAPAVRSQLTQPKPTWWSAKGREGLSIRALNEGELDAKLRRHGWQPMPQEKWWTVEYSKRYKSLTKVFMGTVYSGGAYFLSFVKRMSNENQKTHRDSGIYWEGRPGRQIHYCKSPRCIGIVKVRATLPAFGLRFTQQFRVCAGVRLRRSCSVHVRACICRRLQLHEWTEPVGL
jgi:hypothetical protein